MIYCLPFFISLDDSWRWTLWYCACVCGTANRKSSGQTERIPTQIKSTTTFLQMVFFAGKILCLWGIREQADSLKRALFCGTTNIWTLAAQNFKGSHLLAKESEDMGRLFKIADCNVEKFSFETLDVKLNLDASGPSWARYEIYTSV